MPRTSLPVIIGAAILTAPFLALLAATTVLGGTAAIAIALTLAVTAGQRD